MQYQYVTKLHKQHSSIVSSIPKAMAEELELKAGNHLMWTVDTLSDDVQVCKVRSRTESDGSDKRNQHRKDKGG